MKDDMEMIAYTLLVLKYGKNPWFDENVVIHENEQKSIAYSKKRLLMKDELNLDQNINPSLKYLSEFVQRCQALEFK